MARPRPEIASQTIFGRHFGDVKPKLLEINELRPLWGIQRPLHTSYVGPLCAASHCTTERCCFPPSSGSRPTSDFSDTLENWCRLRSREQRFAGTFGVRRVSGAHASTQKARSRPLDPARRARLSFHLGGHRWMLPAVGRYRLRRWGEDRCPPDRVLGGERPDGAARAGAAFQEEQNKSPPLRGWGASESVDRCAAG